MIRLAVRCAPEYAEHVMANLLELAPNGLEEERGPGWVESAIYGPPGEVPSSASSRRRRAAASSTSPPPRCRMTGADRWADFHRPIVGPAGSAFGPSWWEAAGWADRRRRRPRPRLWHRWPSHHATQPRAAGRARAGRRGFGPIADWGTGSGVLAIAAAKLGWSPVTGCDREDASARGRRGQRRGERRGPCPGANRRTSEPPPVARTVVANLTATCSAAARGIWATPRTRPITLVCSGMLESEADEVSTAFAAVGLSEARRLTEGDWGRCPASRTRGLMAVDLSPELHSGLRLGRRRTHRSPRVPGLTAARRTTSTSATTPASPTARAAVRSSVTTSSRSAGSCSTGARSCW